MSGLLRMSETKMRPFKKKYEIYFNECYGHCAHFMSNSLLRIIFNDQIQFLIQFF